MKPSWQQVKHEFKRIWGYDDFRHPQGEVIKTILAGKDALIIMPTGGGKSICFQLPALLQQGLTLVISPLIALMENQVQELWAKRLPCALLHSETPKYQRQQTLWAVGQQKLRLLYLSPETLLSKQIWQLISRPDIAINGLILDEAHCLAQWGETFRPSYRRLGAVRPALLQTKPANSKIAIAAFTATADGASQKIIEETLKLERPQHFLVSPYRPNLHLKVETIWTPRGRKQKIVNFVQKHCQQSGLVYVRSRRESESLASWLETLGYKNVAYHAGLSASARRQIEEDWLRERLQFVVCTSAFGMGINKDNIRWVCHYQPPQLLSEYIQEVGRGGRDGQKTEALTLVSEPTGLLNPEDRHLRQFFAQKTARQYQRARQLVGQIPAAGKLDSPDSKSPSFQLSLAILHSAGQLEWQDPFSYRINASVRLASINNLLKKQQKLDQQTRGYWYGTQCRWKFLLTAFGFAPPHNFKCGHCDICLRSQLI